MASTQTNDAWSNWAGNTYSSGWPDSQYQVQSYITLYSTRAFQQELSKTPIERLESALQRSSLEAWIATGGPDTYSEWQTKQ
jgi:hypothetical protein